MCAVHFGIMVHSGCSMYIGYNGISIQQLSFNILTVPFSDVKKITVFCNGINIFRNNFIKIEYISRISKKEIIYVQVWSRKSFVKYISQFSEVWEIEITKEKFKKKEINGVAYVGDKNGGVSYVEKDK